jgi:hypothetical protein
MARRAALSDAELAAYVVECERRGVRWPIESRGALIVAEQILDGVERRRANRTRHRRQRETRSPPGAPRPAFSSPAAGVVMTGDGSGALRRRTEASTDGPGVSGVIF